MFTILPVTDVLSLAVNNLYQDVPDVSVDEVFQTLCRGHDFRLERIVSRGQATPKGEWYDQEQDEWVMLLQGEARLRIEKPEQVVAMSAGDYLTIPAHCRHRVEWTAPEQETIWLALHAQRITLR